MTTYDVAIDVDNFLNFPTTANYSYFIQPSRVNNWKVFFVGNKNKIADIYINSGSKIEFNLTDSELLELGNNSINSLLAEDWNSSDDDIWDSI